MGGRGLGAGDAHGPVARSRDHYQGTPIDYLDFASPESGLGGKIGIDATNKIGAETHREWGKVLGTSADVSKRGRRAVPADREKFPCRVAAVKPRVIVGVSGASGAAIGLRIVEILRELGAETHLVVSTRGGADAGRRSRAAGL